MTDTVWVSERPVYTNCKPIAIGNTVSIIAKQYVELDIKTMGRYIILDRAHNLINGILKQKEQISPFGYGGLNKYKVLLTTGEEIEFKDHEYYFKKENEII